MAATADAHTKMGSIQPARAVAPVLLAGIAWIAVLLQLWLSVQLALTNGKSLIFGLAVYLGYFTVLTNIFVALVATAGSLGRNNATWSWMYRASVVGCATTAIIIVGLGYHFLLRKIWAPQGAQWVADILLHYVVPLGTLLHWLMYDPTKRLAAWAPIAWCWYPLVYLAYALARGEILGLYPYPFIDVPALGYPQALANAAGLLVAFIVVGFVVIGLARFGVRTSASA